MLPNYDLLLPESWPVLQSVQFPSIELLAVFDDAPLGDLVVSVTLRAAEAPIVRVGAGRAPDVRVRIGFGDLLKVRAGGMPLLDLFAKPPSELDGSDASLLLLGGLMDDIDWQSAWALTSREFDASWAAYELLRSAPFATATRRDVNREH